MHFSLEDICRQEKLDGSEASQIYGGRWINRRESSVLNLSSIYLEKEIFCPYNVTRFLRKILYNEYPRIFAPDVLTVILEWMTILNILNIFFASRNEEPERNKYYLSHTISLILFFGGQRLRQYSLSVSTKKH